MKGISGIVALLLIVGVVFGAILFAPRFGLNLFAAGGGTEESPITVAAVCDDDGLTRLVVGYQDQLADDQDFLVVDALVYEVLGDGSKRLISSTADETSTTAGTYNEVGTNLLVCKKQYEVHLGDETEEYFRSFGPFVAGASFTRTEVKDKFGDLIIDGAQGTGTPSEVSLLAFGYAIGGETWTGLESGTVEATTNLTLGSGATTNDLTLRLASSTADQGHEAKDGFILSARYNDTAWLRVEPTGVQALSGKIKSSNVPIRSVACPDLVSRVVGSAADLVFGCHVIPVTFHADGGQFDMPMYLALESGIDPDSVSGGSVTIHAIRFTRWDQNSFQNTEKPPSYPMEYGYQGDDEDNIGEPTLTNKDVFFA